MAATVESSALNFKSDAPQLPHHSPPHSNQTTPQMGPNDTTPRSPPASSNLYVAAAQSPPPSKKTMDTVKGVLSKWGKKVGQAAKKTEVLSKSTWQHLKTAPSFGDAAMGRIAQGAKVIAEGGHDKIFQQTFTVSREEQLRKAYACYLSTSAGPVMGVLYLSSAKIAFCSDSPLSYKVGDKTEWTYYKVVIPLENLKEVKPSVSQVNKSEKFIQIVSIDNHEFWFLGFVNYDSAIKNLQQTLDGLLEARMQMNSPPHQQHSQSYPQAQPQMQPEPEPQLQPQHQTQPDVESKLEPELQKQTQTQPVAPSQPPVPLESQSQLQ